MVTWKGTKGEECVEEVGEIIGSLVEVAVSPFLDKGEPLCLEPGNN